MGKWVLKRLFDVGNQATPRFAYQSTVNWMSALAMLCESELYSRNKLKAFYQNVQRRKVNREADTWVYENILMALHNVAALDEMSKEGSDQNAIVRSAIIAWYYAVYYSSSAMVAAASGTKQETHAATIRVWQNDIVGNNWAIGPFGLSLNTLVKKEVENIIKSLRNGNDFQLVNNPQNEREAWGAVYSYLSGTAGYEKWRMEEDIRDRGDLKKLGVKDFRTKKAKSLRDSKLEKGIVNFLTQAFRYRGKANYRDSIYLSYGEDRTESIKVLVENLNSVAATFLKCACFYSSKRVEKGGWDSFIVDLKQNLKIDINLEEYKI